MKFRPMASALTSACPGPGVGARMSLYYSVLQHVLPSGFQKARSYGLLYPMQRHRFRGVKAQLQPDSPQPIDPSPGSRSTQQQVSCRSPALLCPRSACEMLYICAIRRRRGPP
jgi:hypothetical protein